MQKKVQIFIERHHMIEDGDRVVAGVSGGADSVCLLLTLYELSPQMGFSLAAVHVEHGIRGEESRRDAAFTERLCEELGVPFLLYSVDVPARARTAGMGLEEAARELRYECFLEACETFRADKIALAHHASDSAETMLFHLARGTGIRGLCGIRPVVEMTPIRVIRPLLGVTREEIGSWLNARGQAYCIDSTNGDITYSRNRIRKRVLPELEQVNPQAAAHMQKAAEQLLEICDYLDEAAWQAGEGAWEFVPPENRAKESVPAGNHEEKLAPENRGCCIRISGERFAGIPLCLQKHLLHLLLGLVTGSRKDITSFHVERILRLKGDEVGKMLALPGHVTAERTYGGLVLYRREADGANRIPDRDRTESDETDGDPARRRGESGGSGEDGCAEGTSLRIPGETTDGYGRRIWAEILDISEISQKIPENRYTKWFDYGKIKFVVQLRGRRTGDYLQVNAAGGHKKLKNYLIDEKVPRRERDRLSLLADGDHIMWVIGYRISEAYKVTEKTKRVLCVRVEDGI